MAITESVAAMPQRTGAVFCVRVACRDLTQLSMGNATTVCRLTTDGGVFFFDRSQFDAQTMRHGLRHGERVVIGAHRLRDGSAWLHWLGRANGKLWAMPDDHRRWLPPLALVVSVLPFLLTLTFAVGANIALLLLKIGLFATAGFTFAWAVYRLVLDWHPGRRRLRTAMTAFQAGEDVTLCEPPTVSPPDKLRLANGLHNGFALLEGPINNVQVSLQTYGSGRYRYSLYHYHLQCAGESFAIRASASEWRQFIDPVLIRKAPLFVAGGDRVTLLTLLADGEVRGLLNESDGIAHVSYKGTPYTPTIRRAVLTIGVLFLMLIVGTWFGTELYGWYARGVGPDYWDWIGLLHMGGAVLLMITLLFSGLGLIADRIHGVYYRSREKRPIEKILALAFQWRLRQGRSASINEFS